MMRGGGIFGGFRAKGYGMLPMICYNLRPSGEMDERFKSHAWKACIG